MGGDFGSVRAAPGSLLLGWFLVVQVAPFFCEVLGAKLDHRAWTDREGLVYGTLTTTHRASACCTNHIRTSAYLTLYLLRCLGYELRFAGY